MNTITIPLPEGLKPEKWTAEAYGSSARAGVNDLDKAARLLNVAIMLVGEKIKDKDSALLELLLLTYSDLTSGIETLGMLHGAECDLP